MIPQCSSDACGQGNRPCPTPEACHVAPVERRTFTPDYTIDGPHKARRARNRNYLIGFGIAAVVLITARLLVRFLGS